MPDNTYAAGPLPPSSGSLLSFTGLPVDASDRLHESEARFRALAQAAGQIYWIADAKGQLIDAAGWCAFTGQTPEQAMGSGWANALHPEERELVLTGWKVATAASQPYRHEHRVRRADGLFRIMLVQAYPALSADGTTNEWVGVDTDITLLQELRAQALASQEEFRVTFELAAVGMAHVQPEDGRILRANQKFSEMLGYSQNELVGRTFQELTYPSDLTTNLTLFEQLLAQEIPVYSLEKRYIRKDGTLVWANLTASLKRDQNGKPVFGIAVVEDITARKAVEERQQHLEEQLQARVQELEATFTAMQDGLIVLGTDGRILRSNPAYADLVGWPIGSTFYAMPAAERLQTLHIRDERGQPIPLDRLPTSRLLWGSTQTEEQIFRRRDGQDIHVTMRGAPLIAADGRVAGAVIILHDNSVRLALEQQTHDALNAMLRMAELLVEYPLESTEQRSLQVGRHLAELACSLLGCPVATIISMGPEPQGMRVIGTVGYTAGQEAQLDAVITSWAHSASDLAELERLTAGETVLLDTSQSPYWEQAAVFGVRQAIVAPMMLGGRLIGLLVFNPSKLTHSFSKQQIALAGATAQLVGLVVERERLLHESEEAHASALALQESNRQMDTFLGLVSHELRTPVAGMKLNLDLMLRHLEKAPPDASGSSGRRPIPTTSLQDLLASTLRQTIRLERLLADLLDASRSKEGHLALRRERSDLAALVRAIVAEQRQLSPKRAIRLQVADNRPFMVLIDQDRIRQAVMNFLTNALKYSPEAAPIVIGIEREEGQVRVWIRDRGPGIAEANQERIWERFQRGDDAEGQSEAKSDVKSGAIGQAMGQAIGGLGLGLYVTRMVIEQHEGKVGIISAPGKGSTFWLALPTAETDQADQADQ